MRSLSWLFSQFREHRSEGAHSLIVLKEQIKSRAETPVLSLKRQHQEWLSDFLLAETLSALYYIFTVHDQRQRGWITADATVEQLSLYFERARNLGEMI